MSVLSAVRVAPGALVVHPGRALLTSLGIVIGIGAVIALVAAGWPVVNSPSTVPIAVGVAAGVGVFFGFYPAWRISRLEPIDALRCEQPPPAGNGQRFEYSFK
jgi:hypothetical protein